MVTALIILGVALILGIVIAIFWEYAKFYFCALLYYICIAIFKIMDFLQDLFLCFAGLPTTGATGATSKGDLLQTFMTQGSVRNAFLGLFALGVVLLVIFTVIQIIRVEYTTEGAQNAKGNVLKNAFKALCMFAIVPAFCAMGVVAGNYLLKAINAATSNGNATPLSGRLFLLGANDADPKKVKAEADENGEEYFKFVPGLGWGEIFKSGGWNQDSVDAAVKANLMNNPDAGVNGDQFVAEFKHTDFVEVKKAYDITKIGWGYIIIYLVGPLFISALYSAMCGMIMRIYMAIVLYVISPPIVAMMVLDEGSAYKNWRQRFIGNILSGYGTVAAFNLYMMIVEVVAGSDMLHFFEGDKFADFYNRATELLFILVGALMLKNISKTISGIIGADDAMEQGEGVGKQITDKAKKIGKTAIGVGTGAATLAVGGAALIGAAGTGIASRVAAFSGKKRAESLHNKNLDLEKNVKDNKNKAADMRNSRAQWYGKNKTYDDLTDKQKAVVDKSLANNSTYQGLMSSIESDKAQMKENNAGIAKAQTRGRSLHVAASRTGRLGAANIQGMFAGSTLGKSFNQITGNAIKATGGKGVDQWDGEITSKSDTEKDIFQEYNKAKQSKKEDFYNKHILGSRASNYVSQNEDPQVREMAQSQLTNIFTAKEEAGKKEQDLRLDMQRFMDALTRVIQSKGEISASEFEKGFQMAKEYTKLTGNDKMEQAMGTFAELHAEVKSGSITTDKVNAASQEIKSHFDVTSESKTKIEAELEKSGDDIDKLKTALMSGNKDSMNEALQKLQEKLSKEGVQIKDIEQITKEIRDLANTEKQNEKKLTKLMSQVGKLTGK